MRAAASRGDGDAIYRRAHSVAGAARNVGADALARRASALEETVGSLSAAGIATELASMQQELDAVLDRLRLAYPCEERSSDCCHCEERSDAAIPRDIRDGQEIAASLRSSQGQQSLRSPPCQPGRICVHPG